MSSGPAQPMEAAGPVGDQLPMWDSACSLSSFFTMSCKSRAEAFAKKLTTKLRSLGNSTDYEDAELVENGECSDMSTYDSMNSRSWQSREEYMETVVTTAPVTTTSDVFSVVPVTTAAKNGAALTLTSSSCLTSVTYQPPSDPGPGDMRLSVSSDSDLFFDFDIDSPGSPVDYSDDYRINSCDDLQYVPCSRECRAPQCACLQGGVTHAGGVGERGGGPAPGSTYSRQMSDSQPESGCVLSSPVSCTSPETDANPDLPHDRDFERQGSEDSETSEGAVYYELENSPSSGLDVPLLKFLDTECSCSLPNLKEASNIDPALSTAEDATASLLDHCDSSEPKSPSYAATVCVSYSHHDQAHDGKSSPVSDNISQLWFDDRNMVYMGQHESTVAYSEQDESRALCVEQDESRAVCVEQDESRAVCVEQDESGTVCVEQEESGTVCVEQNESGTVCVEQNERGTVCIEQDESGAVCIEHDENETVCIEQDESGAVCVEHDENGTVCIEQDESEAVCVEQVKIETICTEQIESETRCTIQDENEIVCEEAAESETGCTSQEENEIVCEEATENETGCTNQDEKEIVCEEANESETGCTNQAENEIVCEEAAESETRCTNQDENEVVCEEATESETGCTNQDENEIVFEEATESETRCTNQNDNEVVCEEAAESETRCTNQDENEVVCEEATESETGYTNQDENGIVFEEAAESETGCTNQDENEIAIEEAAENEIAIEEAAENEMFLAEQDNRKTVGTEQVASKSLCTDQDDRVTVYDKQDSGEAGCEEQNDSKASCEGQEGSEAVCEEQGVREADCERQGDNKAECEGWGGIEADYETQDGIEVDCERQSVSKADCEGWGDSEADWEEQNYSKIDCEGQEGSEASFEGQEGSEASCEGQKGNEAHCKNENDHDVAGEEVIDETVCAGGEAEGEQDSRQTHSLIHSDGTLVSEEGNERVAAYVTQEETECVFVTQDRNETVCVEYEEKNKTMVEENHSCCVGESERDENKSSYVDDGGQLVNTSMSHSVSATATETKGNLSGSNCEDDLHEGRRGQCKSFDPNTETLPSSLPSASRDPEQNLEASVESSVSSPQSWELPQNVKCHEVTPPSEIEHQSQDKECDNNTDNQNENKVEESCSDGGPPCREVSELSTGSTGNLMSYRQRRRERERQKLREKIKKVQEKKAEKVNEPETDVSGQESEVTIIVQAHSDDKPQEAVQDTQGTGTSVESPQVGNTTRDVLETDAHRDRAAAGSDNPFLDAGDALNWRELKAKNKGKLKTENGDDEEDDARPRARRSSSLKSGKTPPGTPGRKKIVRFADVLGLDLADVRTFLDEIPKVPKSAFLDLDQEVDHDSDSSVDELASGHHGSARHHPSPPLKSIVPMFNQPEANPDFLDRVRDNKICLESAIMSADTSIRGTVRVLNMDFHKAVYVRFTLDSWKTCNDVQGQYVEGSCDGFSDKFSFVIPTDKMDTGNRLEFALRYHCQGQHLWDNNDGHNYIFQCFSSTHQERSFHGRRHFSPSHSLVATPSPEDPWLKFL